MSSFSITSVPLQGNARWFLRRDGVVKPERGFRSMQEASDWIDEFGCRLDWRAGFTFQLKGDSTLMEIVSRQGNVAGAAGKKSAGEAAATASDQPDARAGEVLAGTGRWNEAALRRLRNLAGKELTWTEGPLGFSLSINGVVIGRLNRRPRGRPWTASIEGFERWHAPTRIIKHWHYTPVWAVATLREAKRQVLQVCRSLPDMDTIPGGSR